MKIQKKKKKMKIVLYVFGDQFYFHGSVDALFACVAAGGELKIMGETEAGNVDKTE